MNGKEMMLLPQLHGVLDLKAGSAGLDRQIRWIYFADCLQCIQSEYQIENYIHGGEFVILTNRSMTDDKKRLMDLVRQMKNYEISALGINEGQILDELIQYCEKESIPLFELPEKFPLIDLSQIISKKLVLEENDKNSVEQLFSSILDAKHLNRESVMAQAKYLNIDLSGSFFVSELAFDGRVGDDGDILSLGERIARIILSEISFNRSRQVLTLPQTGSILCLISIQNQNPKEFKEVFLRIAERTKTDCNVEVCIGVGSVVEYLEDVGASRQEAAMAIKVAKMSDDKEKVFFYKDQGIYTLIAQIQNEKVLDTFVEDHLGKLIAMDRVKEGNLCETLEKYLNHNGNAKKTAEAMFLHRNTLNYRLNKIRKVLNCDLEDLDVCLRLKLSFIILNYRKKKF